MLLSFIYLQCSTISHETSLPVQVYGFSKNGTGTGSEAKATKLRYRKRSVNALQILILNGPLVITELRGRGP